MPKSLEFRVGIVGNLPDDRFSLLSGLAKSGHSDGPRDDLAEGVFKVRGGVKCARLFLNAQLHHCANLGGGGMHVLMMPSLRPTILRHFTRYHIGPF
jgi:hypothetical protein